MELDRKTQRVNVILSHDNYMWFKERASEMGVSMSGLMAMALDSYKMQQIVANQMPEMLEVAKRLDMLK